MILPPDDVPDTVATATKWQTWSLDIQGNWDSVTTSLNGTSSTTQTRTHNKQNQATVVGGANLAYDNNGAMTTDETGKTLIYDAWGRLVQVKQGMTVLATYRYDARNRRVTETNGTSKDFYYSDQWQLLEERHGGAVKMQYVWSPVYVDALVLRDRDANGLSGDGLEERLYVQQDANWNTTAVVWYNGSQWEVKERYVYEPYGKPTRLTASWGTPGADTLNWVYLHQGGRYEAATGYYHFRNRELSPTLGRWNRQDPLGFGAGDTNLYRYVNNNPANLTDPSGLEIPGPRYNPFGTPFAPDRPTPPALPSYTVTNKIRGGISIGFGASMQADLELDADINDIGDLAGTIVKHPRVNMPAEKDRIGVAIVVKDTMKGKSCCNGKGDRVWISFITDRCIKN